MSKHLTRQQGYQHPFRRAVLRGLGVVLPPLLTIVFLLWIWNSVQSFVLTPMKDLVRSVAVQRAWDVEYEVPPGARMVELRRASNGKTIWQAVAAVKSAGLPGKRILDVEAFQIVRDEQKVIYCQLPSREWIPYSVYDRVRKNPGAELPLTAEAFYRRDVEARWFRPSVIFPIVFSVFIIVLYLLGKIIAARIGRAFWMYVERIIDQVPFINTVYSTVKKVTDILFADRELEFNRVVAVQYPRKDVWSVGFVTGESLPIIRSAAREPVLSVLMPTSPMPATGFTISVRKSETVELDISVDQAFQFVVSCGVVVPGVHSGDDESVSQAIESRVRDAIESPKAPLSS